MAENLTKVPKRGILKASTSFEQREADHSRTKNPHFDESNILATLHPPDKDYGFMKIDEPKTPYEYASGVDDEDNGTTEECAGNGLGATSLDANLLAARIASEGPKGPRPRRISEPSADEEDLQLLTPEEREKRNKFEQKRKAHYNEFYAVKMARQLMDSDDESDKEADGNAASSSSNNLAAEASSVTETQSSTTSVGSSLDANAASTTGSNALNHTKANTPSIMSNNTNISKKVCSSSVPMDTTNSPPRL